MSTKTIRIGGATGFWGDSSIGARQLVSAGIDYLVFDYLAEITMSILARAREKDPNAGYALDFVTAVLKQILPDCAANGIKIVSNAGGVNPKACGAAIEKLLSDLGLGMTVAVVTGDDLIGRAEEFRARGIKEMYSGDPMPENIVSMNAYLGAVPIARALGEGADIVVTGRVVDSAVTLGALMYEFGWRPDEHDKLAAGSLAGHILECGAQATGGLHTDWWKSKDWHKIGYPVAEVSADGSFVVSKPDGTGGLVIPATVSEQMLYEIGDPQAYMLPDVVCDFADVRITSAGNDKVKVEGARGLPPTDTYKTSATYQDGYRVGMYLTIGGIDAPAKARKTGEAVFTRCREMFREMNIPDFTETSIEVVGAEASYGPHGRAAKAREVVLKLAAKHPEQRPLQMMVREATSSGTSMSPGTTGMGGNRPKVSPVVRLFSCLVPKSEVPVSVVIHGDTIPIDVPTDGGFDNALIERAKRGEAKKPDADGVDVPLVALAWGRSGDKGNHANIGVIARKPEYLPYIRAALSEDAVADYFAHILQGGVERYELPGINALNFMLYDVLGGGGIASLRNDPQGKAYAQMLLDFPVPVPANLAQRDALLDEREAVPA